MGSNNDSRHIERDRLLRESDTDTHSPAYGIDRYAYNQGYDAKYDFQIFENQEPCLIARGGGGSSSSEKWKLYQTEVGALCATDHKWVQNQQVVENKLILQKR